MRPDYVARFALVFAFVCSISELLRQKIDPGRKSTADLLETIAFYFWGVIAVTGGTYITHLFVERSKDRK